MKATAGGIKDIVYTMMDNRDDGYPPLDRHVAEVKIKACEISTELYDWVCERL